MARYQVGFDGKRQETFDDQDEAFEWASEAGETGRLVFAAKGRFVRWGAVAVFPETREHEGRIAWKVRGGDAPMAPSGL
jgi:hypothetical protein